ncbi:MAG: dienelactone hydrolase family protein [Thermoplasmata archaeon]
MPSAIPISVPGQDRMLEAYLAVPTDGATRRAAVIVVHEIFGPDAHIQAVAERFADEGYLALAPNLFTGPIQALLTPSAVQAGMTFLRSLPPEVQRDPSRIRARISEEPEASRAPLTALFQIQDPETLQRFGADLLQVARYLRGRPDVDPRRVGSIGFCFGGGMSGLLSTLDPDLAAAVIFYGNHPPLELIPKIRCPLQGHYGAEDPRITDTVPEFARAMQAAGAPFSYYIYPGAPHAFFNDTRPALYRPEAARQAWERSLLFFRSSFATAAPP